MKLFKAEVQFKKGRNGRCGVVGVHARSISAAKAHLAKKYTAAEISDPITLVGTKHFVIADLVA